MTTEFQTAPNTPHQPSSQNSMGKNSVVLQFTETPPAEGDTTWLPSDNDIITITDVAPIKKIEALNHNESKRKDRVKQSPTDAPPSSGGDKKSSSWLPMDDGIITTSDVAQVKKIENIIDNVLYGSKKTLRRLPVFEEISPS